MELDPKEEIGMPQQLTTRRTDASAESELRRAIDAGELVLHYQPIIELAHMRPVGVEALLRWEHPQGGLLPPDDFLPAVAQASVITEVTRWVLRTACAAAADWPDWTVSVNVTARDVAQPDFATEVSDALAMAGLQPDRLILELTETALVQDFPRAASTLRELRMHGVGVALDDFGTGYSSMLYLRDLPISCLKIDREFTQGIGTPGDDRAIVQSVLALARAVGLSAVAEGVETHHQAQTLMALHCPLAQGYLWSHPVAAHDLRGLHNDGVAGPALVPPPATPPDDRPLDRAVELLSQGASLHTIAAALNSAGYRTERGIRWHPTTVAHLLNRHPTAARRP